MAQSKVKETVDEIIQSGRRSSDGEIRDLLQNASDRDFAEPLHPLDDMHSNLPTPIRVHFASGVCQAYLDRIGYYPIRENPNTTEQGHENLSRVLASQLAELLHRDRLRGLANWDEEWCILKANACAALVVAACGATSYLNDQAQQDPHTRRRMLENLGKLEIIPDRLGTFHDAYEFGLVKFRNYAPQELNTYWP